MEEKPGEGTMTDIRFEQLFWWSFIKTISTKTTQNLNV